LPLARLVSLTRVRKLPIRSTVLRHLPPTTPCSIISRKCISTICGTAPTRLLAWLMSAYISTTIIPITTRTSWRLAAVVFGVAGLLVGIDRGFIDRAQGVARLTKIVGYLAKADRFHGMWPHWLHAATGKVKPFGREGTMGETSSRVLS
jgi:hypothetical protein